MKYPSTPEVIASVSTIDGEGDEANYGDRIIGVSVRKDQNGMVDIDLRDFDRKIINLMIRIPYAEFMAALASAAIHREDD